jgi:hypothetical protein
MTSSTASLKAISARFSKWQPKDNSWELCSFVTVSGDQRLILLTIHYTRLARPLKSHYFRRSG